VGYDVRFHTRRH